MRGPIGQRFPVTIVGPLCTGLDVSAAAEVMAVRVGDLVAVLDAGAYGATESMPFFLSHPFPPELVIAGGAARSRARGSSRRPGWTGRPEVTRQPGASPAALQPACNRAMRRRAVRASSHAAQPCR